MSGSVASGSSSALSRRRVAAVLVAAGLGGMCFAPVFGVPALAGPVLAVCLSAFLIVEGARRSAALVAWRPVLLVVAGLLVIVETMLFATTLAGLPTAATGRALGAGLWSWRRTLESTWPARPEPELALFVPLLVLVACLLAIELLDRFGGLAALLPSLAVIGLSQAYVPASGAAAYLLALGYAATAAAVLAPGSVRSARERGRGLLPILSAAGLAVAGLVGGLLVAGLDPAGNAPYTLRHAQAAQVPAPRLTSPLDEVARRLAEPDTVVFRYRAGEPVDRWRLVALNDFDGSNWTTDDTFLRFGTRLEPRQTVRVPMTDASGEIDVSALAGPWLPSQPSPRAVGPAGGAGAVLVEPGSGTLIAAEQRPRQYTLAWSTPQVTGDALLAAAVDRDVPVGDVGTAPARIVELAGNVVDKKRATFQTALALERFLAERCVLVSSGKQLPTGHGWPQLNRFLFEDRRGTSEQFAAAYVALARLNGIPARLVVGFRAPAVADLDGWTTVRNRDVLVWPEVAVDGFGWWPLDPAGLADPAARARTVGDERDAATSRARKALPPVEQLDDPAVPESDTSAESGPWPGGPSLPAGQLAWVLMVPPIGWVTVVPFARWLRLRRRRRRVGAAAVTGAWAEVRDRLRAHGVPVTAGMTVRDLAAAAAPVVGAETRGGLQRLALAVDAALWSPGPTSDQVIAQAWTAVGEVVQGLRRRPWQARLRAALDARGLLSRSGAVKS